MNAPLDRKPMLAPPLYRLVLAVLAGFGDAEATTTEGQWLTGLREEVGDASLASWYAEPATEDRPLHALADELGLADVEVLAVALASAVEFDPMVGRVLAWLQAPIGGARPTLGLLQTIAAELGMGTALPAMMDGQARVCGLIQFENEARPLPEQAFLVPVPLVLALRCERGNWPGVRLLPAQPELFPDSLKKAAGKQAAALRAGAGCLAVRSGHPREARAAAALVADELGLEAACFEQEPPRGLGPWLRLRGAVPVLGAELFPGEVRRLPDLPGYRGPMLVAAGVEGSFEREGDPVGNWRVPLPLPAERVVLWQAHLAPAMAERVGLQHRHSAVHIEYLSRAARHAAQLDGAAELSDLHVEHAARHGAAGELGTLAHLMPETVPDEALVVPPELGAALQALRQRCHTREGLADHLGPSVRTRYRPGVRALLVGPSGTGKTLAAGWLACALGLPLYRVDLASVASKYIGETEKNLAQLFARAEHTEVVLQFDEADSLFGKRTEVKESNDRFANQQTNYLLQRIESFDGIAILTSNSRGRFDSAFTRRLDSIIEFPSPGPDERRALWQAHLGTEHALDVAQINRIAATCDLAGGHIRNIVLSAAAQARHQCRAIRFRDVLEGINAECRKLGKQVPAGLSKEEGQ
ncbi:MAG: ATP-binding protein [Betaproteobacteria bacterium]|nr:ATP-binding protein [Betaproteobacteria bacterium]